MIGRMVSCLALVFCAGGALVLCASGAWAQEPKCTFFKVNTSLLNISKEAGGMIYIDVLENGEIACVTRQQKADGRDWGFIDYKLENPNTRKPVTGWSTLRYMKELSPAEVAALGGAATSSSVVAAAPPVGGAAPSSTVQPTRAAPPPPAYVSPSAIAVAPALPNASQAPLASLSAPGAGGQPSSAHDGRYTASFAAGCGQQRQSVIIRIEQGTVSWQHELQNIAYSWVGIVDATGAIQASIPGNTTFRATGTLTALTLEVHYPQCASGPLIMQIRGRVK